MHEATLAVNKLAEDLAEANRKIASAKETADMDKERALNALRKEMSQVLTESDIKREVALAKLEAYEKMTDKDDFNREIRAMLSDAIKALGGKGGQPQQQKGGGQPQQGKQE